MAGYVSEERSLSRQVRAEFVEGPGTQGFELHGSGGTCDSQTTCDPGEEYWDITLGCVGCDMPVSLPPGAGVGGLGVVLGWVFHFWFVLALACLL